MKLGAFSISLNVKDINKSKAFYENLGFTQMGGNIQQNWLIMKNEQTVLGLFQDIIPANTLTFNPGWNQDAQNIESFDDIRKIKQHLIQAGIEINSNADDSDSGPAHISLADPDGNPILIDQHR